MSEKHRLLVVEDDPATAQDLVEMIAALGWQSVATDNKRDAEAHLQREQFCMVVLDLQIKNEPDSLLRVEAAGLALLASIRTNGPGVPVVVVSGHVSSWEAGVGVVTKHGATDVVRKPIDDQRLVVETIRSALERTGRSSHDACAAARSSVQARALTISIPGTRHKQRTDIVVHARTVRLTDKPLRTLLRLILGKLENKPVHRLDLGKGEEGIRAIAVLRKDLESVLDGIEIIENDRASNYSLVSMVQIGTCNVAALRKIGNQSIAEVAEQIQDLIAGASP
jgi:CheY-like chemotaxis protein